MTTNEEQHVDVVTIVGLGLILMPLLTIWHEIGGHAAACVVTGGTVRTIGAFYVDCDSATLLTKRTVACAGVFVDACLAVVAWAIWRRACSDGARLAWWLVALTKSFVAAGYFLFSGFSGVGDLGPGPEGGIGPLPLPALWRVAFVLIGGIAYWRLVVLGIRSLAAMIGEAVATNGARKRVAHSYYVTIGAAAVLVGLLNPIGFFITILSAAASSFGAMRVLSR